MALRFLSFFLISFLLLSPFIKNLKKIVHPPVIVTAWDNSLSMVSSNDSSSVFTRLKAVQEEIQNELGGEFKMVNYQFGEEAQNLSELTFSEKKSDYSNLISTVNNNHFNEKIGALILVGDGIYNQGKNPVNLVGEIKYPVYTIGLGDTSEIADARIEKVLVNRTAFSGNRFPVEVDISFLKLRNMPLKLSVIQGEEVLASEVITPPNNNFFTTREFLLEAGKPGLQHFSVSIETVKNERNIKNNKEGFVINVLESKQKILILSDGTHPDIGALKNVLDQQKTYDVSVFTEEPYPSNLSEFNLIVLNQLPTTGKSIAKVISGAEKSRIPLLFIVGNKTFLPQLNILGQGVKIIPQARSGELAQAVVNPAFGTFLLSDDLKEMIPKFPPLQVAFGNFQIGQEFTPILYQKIKNIETTKPLLAAGMLNGRKTGFIFGEGIWRWRLYEYYFLQEHSRFNELVSQLVQYLALRENEDNFVVKFDPVYPEIDDVVFNAEVYNDAFERVANQEIQIKLKNRDNEEFTFTFDVQGNKYSLNAGHLPIGDYTFFAEVTIGGETFSETGSFTIVPVNLENVETRANHQVLYQLATQSGGAFCLPAQINNLFREIKAGNNLKPEIYFQEMINELLNLRWLFFVFLLLLSVEWFLRKFWGIY